MALFGKKKGDDQGAEGSAAATTSGGGFSADPAKAKRFFDHATAVHETTNYAYATVLWLQGLRQDPTSIQGIEGFFASARDFAAAEKRDKPTRDQASSFSGKGPLERYLLDLLHWGLRPDDPSRVIRVIDDAAKLDLQEQGYWVAEKSMPLIMGGGRAKKDTLLKLMKALQDLGAFDLAVKAGEAALATDPTDGELEAEVRNLAAAATMSRGGYESVEEGSFRRNIRDAEQQRKLEEESRIVKSEDASARVVEAAKADYESRPTDTNSITRYVRALQERGQGDDLKVAHDLLVRAHKQTGEFRFRQQAGEIRLRHARRQLEALRKAAAQGDEQAKQRAAAAQRKYDEMELAEIALRVENYPTDLGLKYELGVRQFNLGNDEDAIALFQESQHDAKHRLRSLYYLGEAFKRMGWVDEAADTLRRALEMIDDKTSEFGLQVRYGLMESLMRKAREQSDADAAEEANRIGSGIAMQQISYRDIREKRDELKALLADLKSA